MFLSGVVRESSYLERSIEFQCLKFTLNPFCYDPFFSNLNMILEFFCAIVVFLTGIELYYDVFICPIFVSLLSFRKGQLQSS